MVKKHLYLFDATAFCYRAFYALPRLTTSFGFPTGAIYGFINILNKLIQEEKPEYLAVCFDVSRDTFRSRKFAEYKIQRPPMPDDLSAQISLIKEIVSAYSFVIMEKAGFEADDIIATLADKAKKSGFAVTIVSSDKDILQLVDEDTLVLSPHKDEAVRYDLGKVTERFGVGPKQITDIVALMGDDVDNIPGVSGIGEKTAVGLIKKFGSLDNLLKDPEKIEKEKLRESVLQSMEKIRLNRELAILDRNVDIAFEPGKFKIGEPDAHELCRLFKYLEFKKLLKDLSVCKEPQAPPELAAGVDKELEGIIELKGELFLAGRSPENIVFCFKNKIFRLDKNADHLKKALASSLVCKTGHDLKSIRLSLIKENIALTGAYFDTMVASYLLNPSRPAYDLESVLFDQLGLTAGEGLSLEQEVAFLQKLRPKLEDELRAKSLWELFCDLEMPLIDCLCAMEHNGIKIDLELLGVLSREIEKRLIKLIDDIYRISETQFNINSPKQLREILFEKLKLPVVKRSKTGPSTDEEVLRRLAPRHELPALLLEYRQLMKLKNTYIDTLPGLIDPRTQRVHTSFNQTATETGRLSSSNPNLQNIPVKTDIGRKIRQAIVCGSIENCLVSCDYSQIELRILAHLSADTALIEAFKNDADIHRACASLIYGVGEQDVSDPMREVAKRVNFGIVYGLTSYGLSRDLGISPQEAQNFIDAYFLKYPKVKDYIAEQIEKAKKNGFVTTILGRRRYLPEINNKNQGIRQLAERQAVNTPIQGSASDLIKLAMVEIHRQISADKLSALMIMQIHDELVFDLPKSELSETVKIVKDRMENVLKLDVPIKVDIKKGNNWLDMEEC